MSANDDPFESSHLIDQLRALAAGRAPFVWRDAFVPTRFATVLISIFELCRATHGWRVVCAQPGAGKSTALARYVLDHTPATVERIRQVPVLDTRLPHGHFTANALMYALASRLGPLPRMTTDAFRAWFVVACDRAGVELIVIDDAHELTLAQANYLREFTDDLKRLGRRVGLVLLSAVDSLEPAKQPLWALIRRSSLTTKQFDRRLHGTDPLVLVQSESLAELGDVLASFEELNRDQFPDLRLARYAESVFGWLTDPRVDTAHMGRVKMASLCDVLEATLAELWIREMRGLDPDATILYRAAMRHVVRGSAFTLIASLYDEEPDEEPPAAAPAVAA